MKLANFIRVGLASWFLALLTGAAFADIGAFNAVVKAGDYKTAASEAKVIWAGWNHADPDTAVVAREFGFASYVAGDYAAARDYGQFLVDRGGGLTKPDDQPLTSRVLLAAASFRLTPNDSTRKDLFVAVKAREASPGLDSISMLASEALYKADWAAGRWRDASQSGLAAYNMLERGGETLAPRALEARTTGAAGDFLAQRDQGDYNRMVDIHGAIIDAIDNAKDLKRREALVNLSFTALAWSASIFEYFEAADQIGSNIPIKIRAREMRKPAFGYFASDMTAIDALNCPIVTNVRAINYPTSAVFQGMIGTVVMKLALDDEGRITDAKTLAAVPSRHFADAVQEAVPKLKFARAPKAPAGCTLARENYVFTVVFRIL